MSSLIIIFASSCCMLAWAGPFGRTRRDYDPAVARDYEYGYYGNHPSIFGNSSSENSAVAGQDYSDTSGKIKEKPSTWNPLNLDWRNLPGVEQNPPHTHANEKPTWEPIPVTVLPWKRSRWQDYDPAVGQDYGRYG